MEKLNYCKKKCICGKNIRMDGSFNNGNFVILRCNNPNCLKEYYMDSKKAIKCDFGKKPDIFIR